MNIDGNERRAQLISYLKKRSAPVNGTELSGLFAVSRQVIVQDIALLRVSGHSILSTNRGYMLYEEPSASCGHTAVIRVRHTPRETLDEMKAVVEYGGSLLDVFVEHDLYGQIRADLDIRNLSDAETFCDRLLSSSSLPLNTLTGEYHYHTITAPSPKVMKLILAELDQLGFLMGDEIAP